MDKKSYKMKNMLKVEDIVHNLETNIIGKEVICFESLSSTMEESFIFGSQGGEEGAVIYSEMQTAGKGRLGRQWHSIEGKGIYVSIILRPDIEIQDIPKITLLSGIAVYEAIKNMCGVDLSIKWPNDLLIKGKKVCGLLTEMYTDKDNRLFVVVGIGVNVNHEDNDLLLEATSLRMECGKSVARLLLLKEILRSLDWWYSHMKKSGFSIIFKKWKEYTSTLNKVVSFDDTKGIAIDLDSSGGLCIQKKDGIVVKYMSGDIKELEGE